MYKSWFTLREDDMEWMRFVFADEKNVSLYLRHNIPSTLDEARRILGIFRADGHTIGTPRLREAGWHKRILLQGHWTELAGDVAPDTYRLITAWETDRPGGQGDIEPGTDKSTFG